MTEPDGVDRNGDRLAQLCQLEEEMERNLAAIRAARQEEEQRLNPTKRPARDRAKLLGWGGIVGGIAAAAVAVERSLRQHVLLTATAVAAGTAATISLGVTPLIEQPPSPPGITEPAPTPTPPLAPAPTPKPTDDATPSPSPSSPPGTESPTPTPTPTPSGSPATAPPTGTPTSEAEAPAQNSPGTPPPSSSPSPEPAAPPAGTDGGAPPAAEPVTSACILGVDVPVLLRLRALCAPRSGPPGTGERGL